MPQPTKQARRRRSTRVRPATREVPAASGASHRPLTSIATPRVIVHEGDIRDGIKALRRKCAIMRRLHDLAGDPPLRRNQPGFAGLARIIVGQQVSVASADAIWRRFETIAQPMSAEVVAAMSDDDFRAAGLSRPKVKTLRAIAYTVAGGLDLEALAIIDEAVAREQLLAISGIGPWTADIYLMFCAGRADVFAPGDLALQIAAQLAFELEERPDARALAEIAERWAPWRGVAARMLWAYYRIVRQMKSGAPV